jgi:hypothetical protein
MPDQSTLFVPLRSNGSALLTGKPIESVRRRLKFASVYFDHVFLEAGIYEITAGPSGAFGSIRTPRDGEVPRWQSPVHRGAGRRQPVQVTFGGGQGANVVVDSMATVPNSKATISWKATLQPFAGELPAGADWIDFVPSRESEGYIKQMTSGWNQADEHNTALQRAIPELFVRSVVIENVNHDLGSAARVGGTVSVDPLHHQVVAQRFGNGSNWPLAGFAVRFLFPQIGEFSWEAIADLRRDPQMVRLRGILREVEEEAVAESAAGDIEAAARHAYHRHLAAASGAVDTLGAVARKTGASIIIAGAIGASTLPIPPLLGFTISTAVGGVVSAIGNVRGRTQQQRSKGWVSLTQRIEQPQLPVSPPP